MKKKLDTISTMVIGYMIWTVEFLRNPHKCIERLGSREELKSRVLMAMDMKYTEE